MSKPHPPPTNSTAIAPNPSDGLITEQTTTANASFASTDSQIEGNDPPNGQFCLLLASPVAICHLGCCRLRHVLRDERQLIM
jgi:hypothetical protein